MKKTFIEEMKLGSYLMERVRISGEGQLFAEKHGDEIAHNAVDNGADKLSMVITKNTIFYGNNSDFCDWKTYKDRFVKSPAIGPETNSTSYYGSGGSTIWGNIDGSYNYTIHVDKGDYPYKFFLRQWKYKNSCLDENYTRAEGNNVLFSDGGSVVEYEIDYNTYLKMAMVEELGFEPTFMVMVRRFTDSERTYSARTIIKNINNTLIFKSHLLAVTVRVENKSNRGLTADSKQLWFPFVVVDKGGNFRLPRSLKDLPKFKSLKTITYCNGTFEMYIFKKVTRLELEKHEFLQKETSDFKDVFKTDDVSRGSNGIHLVIDRNNTLLQSYDSQTVGNMKWPVGFDKDDMNNNIVIIKHIDGKHQFPTIKSAKPGRKFMETMVQAHIVELEKQPHLKHKKVKIENIEVARCITQLTTNGPERPGLVYSLDYLTEKNVDTDIFTNKDCHEEPDKYIEDRECDWVISKTPCGNDYILNLEFARGTEDWDHVDGLVSRIAGDIADYHVYVVDEFSTGVKYRKRLQEYCKNIDLKSKVWLVRQKDLREGRVEKFKSIK